MSSLDFTQHRPRPLVVLLGPTASGKSALALAIARHFQGEVLSCDSVAVYRHMQLGTAKPTAAERISIPHHLLDLHDPTLPFTAGDYARHARTTLAHLAESRILPILAGGTGLYARALLDGLFPAPPANPRLRDRLRTFTSARLHRLLVRLDPHAATLIHHNDTPKLLRAVEVSFTARQPITRQWTAPRDALTGYRILRLTLAPPREQLHLRIETRARAMFAAGLIAETAHLIQTFGPGCRPFQSLGYKQAAAVLRSELTEPEAIALTAQGHRQYAKRQLTWFRREAQLHPTHWLEGTGDSPHIEQQTISLVLAHLQDFPIP